MTGYVKIKFPAFTIIELLVAVSVFALSLTVMSGAIVSILRAQQQAQESIRIINQESYALEYMGRILRMAKKDLNGLCLNNSKDNYNINASSSSVRFVNYRGLCQEFFLDGAGQLQVRISTDQSTSNFGAASPLTSQSINVVRFQVGLVGETQADELQPLVTLLTELQPRNGSGPAIIAQTSISQRNLDIKR